MIKKEKSFISWPFFSDFDYFTEVISSFSTAFIHILLTLSAEDRLGRVTQVSSQPVIIDNTPPTIGHVAAGTTTSLGRQFVSGGELEVHCDSVKDEDSGLLLTEVSASGSGMPFLWWV